MTLPSFIIIGAQKCGTTSLYNYMIEHPQILPASKKELHFFNWVSKPGNRKKPEGVDWYLSQFPTIPDGKNLITGEATPDYLVDPHTPQRMFNLLPDVKLILLLRNPIDRAVSHYHHNRRISKKREPLPFRQAIEKEPERLNLEKEKLLSDENYRSLFHRNYSYLERGIYIEQLEKWMSIFPREQFLILKSEDFYDRPDVILKEVFEFLGLPNYQVTNKKKYNELSYQPIAPKIRSTLAEYFQPYNQRLEEYLGIKFNWEMNFDKAQKQYRLLLQFKDKLYNNKSQLKQIKLTLDSKSNAKPRSIGHKSDKNVVSSSVQSKLIVIENYDASYGAIYNELFWGYEIKEIQEKTNNQDTINISGWVLGKKCPVVAIEIVELSSVLKNVSVNQLRPDVVKRYPEALQVEEIGFSIDFQVNKLRPKLNWLIQAVFADETRMPIGCIRTNNTKSVNIRATPLLTEEAIKFLEHLFKQKPHAKVLEFGSGGSTIWLSKLTKNLTSIEHDGRWFQQVKNQIQKQKNCNPVDIKLLARPYHTICEKFPEESFDLIIVDGRDRMKCFEASIKLLKPGGILMLDDAQREKYKQTKDLLKDWQFTKTVTKTRHTYWWEKPFQETILVEKNQSTSQQKSTSQKLEENLVIADTSMTKEENRLFQIHNAIFQSIKVKRQTWVGGVVFPKDMPEKFRHRRGVTLNQFRYVDQPKPVDKNKSIIENINNSKFYSGTYIYGGHFQPHFGHALTESIHRLWAFNSNIHDGIVFAVSPGGTSKGIKYTPPQWFIQTLEILEIPIEKCIWVKRDCTFENLIIPEPGSELSIGLKEWYRPYLEKRQQRIFDATYHLRKDQKELKLFLGRTHIPLSGYTAGEKYLENLLVNEGYISFKPENYNILEQISYLMSAKKIIFSEGSAIYTLELINYLDADIVCLPRRPDNQHFYPHIYSKCRNYIIAGNTNDILLSGIWRKGTVAIKQTPITQHPYQVVESLKNHNFARLKDWEEEEFLAQEKSDIMEHIYQVHTTLEKPDPVRYLEILEGYLQVRPNQNESLNIFNHPDIIERYLQEHKNQNESANPETDNSIVIKNRSGRLNQLARINQSSNYLEIGVSKGVTFNAINIKNKVAVDPKFRFNTNKYATDNVVFLEVTSDDFFRNYATKFNLFDLIYLDGLHTFEQTFRDFCASVSLAHAKTIWLIDDTCPGSYAQVQPLYQNCAKLKRFSQEKGGGWMGDVFKIVAAIHDFFPQFSFATFPDHGQTVIWNQWREDFQPLWNSLETISRLEYLDFVELQETLFKREPYEQIFASIKSAIS